MPIVPEDASTSFPSISIVPAQAPSPLPSPPTVLPTMNDGLDDLTSTWNSTLNELTSTTMPTNKVMSSDGQNRGSSPLENVANFPTLLDHDVNDSLKIRNINKMLNAPSDRDFDLDPGDDHDNNDLLEEEDELPDDSDEADQSSEKDLEYEEEEEPFIHLKTAPKVFMKLPNISSPSPEPSPPLTTTTSPSPIVVEAVKPPPSYEIGEEEEDLEPEEEDIKIGINLTEEELSLKMEPMGGKADPSSMAPVVGGGTNSAALGAAVASIASKPPPSMETSGNDYLGSDLLAAKMSARDVMNNATPMNVNLSNPNPGVAMSAAARAKFNSEQPTSSSAAAVSAHPMSASNSSLYGARTSQNQHESDAAIKARAALELLGGGGPATVPGVQSFTPVKPPPPENQSSQQSLLGLSQNWDLPPSTVGGNSMHSIREGREEDGDSGFSSRSLENAISSKIAAQAQKEPLLPHSQSQNSVPSMSDNSNFNDSQNLNAHPTSSSGRPPRRNVIQNLTSGTPSTYAPLGQDDANENGDNNNNILDATTAEVAPVAPFAAQIVEEDYIEEAAAVAVIDEEQEEEQYEENKNSFIRRIVGGTICGIIVILAVSIPMAVRQLNGRFAPSDMPSVAPSLTPTFAPSTDGFQEVVEYLSSIVYYDPVDLQNSSNPSNPVTFDSNQTLEILPHHSGEVINNTNTAFRDQNNRMLNDNGRNGEGRHRDSTIQTYEQLPHHSGEVIDNSDNAHRYQGNSLKKATIVKSEKVRMSINFTSSPQLDRVNNTHEHHHNVDTDIKNMVPNLPTNGIPLLEPHKLIGKSSPQYRAVEWLSQNLNPPNFTIHSPNFIQRYILAVFYFSLNGDEWTACHQSDSVCKDNQVHYLSDEHECDWYGHKCDDEDGMITQIFIGM